MAYCEKQDVYDMFGQVNVSKWADLDNDKDSEKIDARIDRAINWGESEVESLLRRSVYDLPITNVQDEVPAEITHITASLAGVYLYENRGIQDFNPETGQVVHRLAYIKDRAMKMIRQILAGQRDLDATKVVDGVPKGAN